MRHIPYKLEYSNIEDKNFHSSDILIAARFLAEEHKVHTTDKGICLLISVGAVEKTRTSTGFLPQRPQRCASTSSATTAYSVVLYYWRNKKK